VKEYHDLLRLVLEKDKPKEDRTGVGTISYFGVQTRFDLAKGFPLLTTKRVHFKSMAFESIWIHWLLEETASRALTRIGWSPDPESVPLQEHAIGFQLNYEIRQIQEFIEGVFYGTG
jgi:Thymidylate synthase